MGFWNLELTAHRRSISLNCYDYRIWSICTFEFSKEMYSRCLKIMFQLFILLSWLGLFVESCFSFVLVLISSQLVKNLKRVLKFQKLVQELNLVWLVRVVGVLPEFWVQSIRSSQLSSNETSIVSRYLYMALQSLGSNLKRERYATFIETWAYWISSLNQCTCSRFILKLKIIHS